MKRAALLPFLIALSAVCQPRPYKSGGAAPAFEAPGRDEPAPKPADVRDVPIGWFGPQDDSDWRGATLAIEDANRRGGYTGMPFRLIPAWSVDPWRGGASLVTRLVFRDRVWAIVGSADAAATHVAEQVAAKALLTLVNPAATDRSIHMAGLPWVFSVVPGDHQHAALLARELKDRGIVILSATDHDARAFLGVFRAACARQGTRVLLHLEFEPARPDLSPLARDTAAVRSDAAVVVASARDGARAVKALRASGFRGAILGTPSFGRNLFAEQGGAAAEGVLFPWIGEPAPDFGFRFQARFGGEPDYAAACAYDAVGLVVGSILEAGLNRARIRDAMARAAPSTGASGHIEWDEYGQNCRSPVLAEIRGGRPRATALGRSGERAFGRHR